MTITGQVFDANTKQPIDFEVMVWGPDSLMLSAAIIKAGDKYSASETDSYLRKAVFVFNAKGYTSNSFTGEELYTAGGNVFLKKSNILLYGMAAVTAVVLMAKLKEKKKRVGKLETNDVLPWLLIAGAFIGFKAIQKALAALGLGGPGGKAADEAMNNPYSPFNANFWEKVPNNVAPLIITESAVQGFITTIHDAFRVLQDDFNTIWGVFSQLKTQSQVAYLSQKFVAKYKESLLPFLQDGGGILPWDGLSDKHLAQIMEYVSKLPLYKP